MAPNQQGIREHPLFLPWSLCGFSGASLTGNEAALILGSSAVLNCSSDLPILTAEWLYNDVVIASSAGEVLLTIPEVNDSLHNRKYTCRVTTPYGIEERNTTIAVAGKYVPTV